MVTANCSESHILPANAPFRHHLFHIPIDTSAYQSLPAPVSILVSQKFVHSLINHLKRDPFNTLFSTKEEERHVLARSSGMKIHVPATGWEQNLLRHIHNE